MASSKKKSSNKSKLLRPADRTMHFVRSVLSGEIVAGPYVRAACKRFIFDLETAFDRGYYYDSYEAHEGIAFFEECLCLNGGQFEGKPFLLFPWQDFIIGNVFGWKKLPDGISSNDKEILRESMRLVLEEGIRPVRLLELVTVRRFRVVFVETGKGPLSLDTPIATPNGWSTMGDIKVGDYVFNSLGIPTIVTNVSPVFHNRNCFKLKFSDGDEIIADEEHEWMVTSLRNGKKFGPRKGDIKKGEIEKRNTKYISETYKIKKSKSIHPQAKWNHRINVAPALEIKNINLPIPPYSLGVWLGDGNTNDARLTVAYNDWQIVDEIKKDGILVNERSRHSVTTARVVLGGDRSITKTKTFQGMLRSSNLLGNKHIPEIYFRAGTKQRLSLLQGIMDTDGHVAKNGHCEITLCHERLSFDIADLLRTLGYKCTIRKSIARCNGKVTGDRWRIVFQGYRSQPPVRLLRKVENLGTEPQTRPLCRGRMIVSCEPVASVPVKCITVASEDHMFLAGKNLIPTCNSGKSPLCAGVGIKGLVADKEERAEIYAAAPLSLDTPVLTINGWKTQGTLSVGDVVFDEEGNQCNVDYISPVMNNCNCYVVEFDDGTKIVTDENHLWKTVDNNGQNHSLYKPSLSTTSKIRDTLRCSRGRKRHRIEIAKFLKTDEAQLPIDPYTLGVWLGDGNSRRGSFCYHKDDSQIRSIIERNGSIVSSMKDQNNVRYCTILGLRTKLRENNLLENKHIPFAYMMASYNQRMELLRGLMDTDGMCTNSGECRFCQLDYSLALSVYDLVISIGIRANIRKIKNKHNGLWIVSFKSSKKISVFNLKRKHDKQNDDINTVAKARYISNVTPCDSVPVKCVGVTSKSHLYLVSRANIPTHNTLKDQAMVLFRDACAFYDQSPWLQQCLIPSGVAEKRWNLAYVKTNSFFRVIASDTKKGKSGPRPHMALLDEIHEHADGSIIEMLRAGFKFRRQPLSFMITNSGHDMQSVAREYHDMGVGVVSATDPLDRYFNDEFFSFICSLDDEDFIDPVTKEEDDHYLYDESLWPKVNPSLPYGVPGYDYIRSQVKEARGLPSKLSTIKRLLFCVWTESEDPAISKEAWMACLDKDYPLEILKGRKSYGGLDLSSTTDLTAFALLFEPGYIDYKYENRIWTPSDKKIYDPYWRLKVWFWVPGIGLHKKAEKDHVPYIAWRDSGYIIALDRKTVEYEFVISDIYNLCRKFLTQKIAFDRWNMKNFQKALTDLGVTLPELVEFGQGYQSMSPAIKVFETKLIEGTMRHDGNPCLTWCMANVVAVSDAAENKKYDKSRSSGRIDGSIATVMAHGIIKEVTQSSYTGLTKEQLIKKLKGEDYNESSDESSNESSDQGEQ